MAIDGGTQLVGLRQSTWWLRLVTGTLFGVGSVWVLYPQIEAAMRDLRQGMENRGYEGDIPSDEHQARPAA